MKKKLLLTSILSIVMCFSLIVGATFALFTSESTVNVAVTSGKVKVTATVDGFEYKTLNKDWTVATDNKTVFDDIGGSAELKDGTITLDKIVPGDGVRFAIEVKNESNVTVKYQTSIKMTTESSAALFDALTFTVDGDDFSGEKSSGWFILEPTTTEVATINVVIELPEDADGEELMEQACAVEIIVSAIQGNVKDNEPEGENISKVAEGLFYETDEKEYYITNVEGFKTMREMVKGEQIWENDGTWILYNNLDLNGVDWEPIEGFHGTFDGNGKTISNMNASFLAKTELGGTDNIGGGRPIIKDVTFHKATITGTEYVGVVVGNAVGVTIENVKVTEATVTGTKYVGGIVGYVYTTASTITGCTVTGSTIKAIDAEGKKADGKVGGIVGFVAIGKVTGNTVTGCTISGPECVGGIAGRGGSGDTQVTIYDNFVSDNTVSCDDDTTVGEQIGDKLNVKESE